MFVLPLILTFTGLGSPAHAKRKKKAIFTQQSYIMHDTFLFLMLLIIFVLPGSGINTVVLVVTVEGEPSLTLDPYEVAALTWKS